MSTVPSISNFRPLNLLQQLLLGKLYETFNLHPSRAAPILHENHGPSWLGSFIGLNSPLLLCRPPSRGSETLNLCKHIFRQCKVQARGFGMITVGSSKRRTSGAPSVQTKKFPGIIPSSESTEIYLRRYQCTRQSLQSLLDPSALTGIDLVIYAASLGTSWSDSNTPRCTIIQIVGTNLLEVG